MSILNSSLKKTSSSSSNSSKMPIYKSIHSRVGYLNMYNDLEADECEETEIIRNFPKSSYKILNAPKLKDDFYTTLLDWSKDDNISVILDNAAYVWASKGNDA